MPIMRMWVRAYCIFGDLLTPQRRGHHLMIESICTVRLALTSWP